MKTSILLLALVLLLVTPAQAQQAPPSGDVLDRKSVV